MNDSSLYDRIIEPFAQCLTREAAQKIVDVRADAATQEKFESLADKANRGVLTDFERFEYEKLRALWYVVSMFQVSARRILKGGSQKDQPS